MIFWPDLILRHSRANSQRPPIGGLFVMRLGAPAAASRHGHFKRQATYRGYRPGPPPPTAPKHALMVAGRITAGDEVEFVVRHGADGFDKADIGFVRIVDLVRHFTLQF